jgi:hypothetical protein
MASRRKDSISSPGEFAAELRAFAAFGRETVCGERPAGGRGPVPVFVNEFWTAKQRAGHPVHEVSYRACFKPALPRFFIERLSAADGLVYDPFMGRGTTLVEAMLLGRRTAGCDINPICRAMVEPRLHPPRQEDVVERLASIPLHWDGEVWSDLEVFYHPETLREIAALRAWLLARDASGGLDDVDRWIRMVAVNRLTGHSPGFFSVYTLPPNQAVSIQSQRRINAKRGQTPPRRHVRPLIERKSRQLLSEPFPAASLHARARPVLLTGSCDATPGIAGASVDLVVTSPPFLDVVDYTTDNWLRGWFCGVDTKAVRVWQLRKLGDWSAAMERVMRELLRVLRPGGWLAFEVGEIDKGQVALEEHALAIGVRAGFDPVLVLVNQQKFTKTANCWGVDNDTKGTNSNRVVVFRRP